jgi:glyoxylase-like metal-dependent hydrolase (beta-lactamase superfamily II)
MAGSGSMTDRAPEIRHVLAPNPSAMTAAGTNCWIVGSGRVAVIDPGPDHAAHLAALLAALRPGEAVSHIFVTHSHLDHSGGAARLSAMTGAPVLAFGPSGAGQSDRMRRLVADGLDNGGEGVDRAFDPDVILRDGDVTAGDTWSLAALHCPGHFGNHLCFLAGGLAFTGDHVMGWSTSLIAPPDGDMTDYLASLDRLSHMGAVVGYSGHGPVIGDLPGRIAELAAHRRLREAGVLAQLAAGPADATAIAAALYTDIPATLMPAAVRNVLAHLIDLQGRNLVACEGKITLTARFRHP